MHTESAPTFRLSPQQSLQQRLATSVDSRRYVRGTAVIEGALDRQRIREAIRLVAARYEILRTRFIGRAGVSLQVIGGETQLSWRLAEDSRRHLLTLEASASCADAVSLELLFREIADRYAGVERDETPLQYADLATWLNEMAAAAGPGADFWHEALDGLEDAVTLPTERTPDEQTRPEFRTARRVIRDGSDAALGIARAANVSSTSVLLACFEILLSRLTDAKQLLVGVTLPGRSYPGIDSAIGPLERQLPLAHEIDSNQTVGSLLSSLEEQLDRVGSWQEYFSWELAEQRGQGSTHFGFSHHELAAPWSSGALQWQIESLECAVQPNVVSLSCTSSPHGLKCELSYDQTRLSDAAAATLLRQFETVLHAINRAPLGISLADIDLVSDEERAVLAAFNSTAHDGNSEGTVLSMFHQQVLRAPGHIALVSEHGSVTYAELEERANWLASLLIAKGVGAEHVVGVCLDRGASLIASFLAIWKAGAAYLPLHNLPEMRLRYLGSNSGARLVITDQKYASHVGAAGFDIVDVDSPEIRVQSSERPASRSETGNLAYVMYTSGSTGEPKGVLVEHRSLVNYMLWVLREYGLGEHERVLMKTSIGFDASIREWLMPLLQGGTLILLQEDLQRDPRSLIRELRDQHATTLHVVPTLLRVLLEEPTFRECAELQRVFVGGELLDAALVKRFHESTGKVLINMYGPTETTVSATSIVVERHEGGAIGRPVANTQVHVLRRDLSQAAIGEVGEICIGGVAVARGYSGRADHTAEKYLPDPYCNGTVGGRLYLTGDRGRRRPDGALEFLGRRDGQVKVRGYRVELNEIERALLADRDVLHAAVLLKERAAGDKRLVAYVHLNPTVPSASISEIDANARKRLPDYMCPSQYVRLESFPRTHSGKLDRVALAALETSEASSDGLAPRSDLEDQLAHIWSSVLGIAKVGVTDNFFQIGGDSIIAIQIAARARQAGIQFTPLQLFQYQTIAELAQAAKPARPSVEAAVITTGEVFALTPIQRSYFERHTDNLNHFNQGLLLVVPAHLKLVLLEQALIAVYKHHDALRLRFERTAAGWQQCYAPGEFEIVRRDLSHTEDPVQSLRAEIALQHASLDVSAGPLVRIVLFQLGGDLGHRLLLIAHHLVIDSVSWRILLEDVSECYAQLERGADAKPPLSTASYRSWSEGLREYVKTQDLQADLMYWREVHARTVDPLCPYDPTGANTVALERLHVANLQESETRALLSDAAKPYKTHLMELFLSALSEALHRWRGLTAVEVMLEGHGREEILSGVDLTRTVGWFTSMYPVVLESRGGESIADRIKRTKEQLRAVPRRGVSYGLLRYLRADSQLSSSASLLVNYLGQMDGAIGRDAFLPAAREAGADSASGGLDRGYELTLNALIHGGRLQMYWTYSGARFTDDSVGALAQHLEDSLRELITHCCSPQAGGFTLSDVRGFGWGASQLDAIGKAISRAEQRHAS